MIHALKDADADKSVSVIVLTGAGDKAFCTGGDQASHEEGGGYGGRGIIGLPVEEMQSAIRDMSKPVIARVNGYAIGGGNVIVTMCDLAIASDRAQLGQAGPRVGSVDPGFGTALLARDRGRKEGAGDWYLCRRYSAQEACRWAWSTPSFLTTSSMRKSGNGATKSWKRVPRRSLSPSARSMSIRK